jgi:hypothetical protein
VIKLGASVKHANVKKNEVLLEDGTIISGSVIVGADGKSKTEQTISSLIRPLPGLWSSTRGDILGTQSPPTETGDLAYRGTFSKAQLLALQDPEIEALCAKRTVTVWMGPDKHTVFYPVKSGTQFNMVLLRPDNLPTNARVVKGDIEEMRDTFKGWDPVYVPPKTFHKRSPDKSHIQPHKNYLLHPHRPQMEIMPPRRTQDVDEGSNISQKQQLDRLLTSLEPHRPPRRRLPPNPTLPSPRRRHGRRRRRRAGISPRRAECPSRLTQ